MRALVDRLAPTPVLAVYPDRDVLAEFGEDVRRLGVGRPALQHLLVTLHEHSPFLWRLAQQDQARLLRILSQDPEDDLAQLLTEVTAACAATSEQAVIRKLLRQARAHVALSVAFADLGGLWPLTHVTRALTRAADTFVQCALDHLLAEAARAGRLMPSAQAPGGLFVLALGKHGAGELNYSSDVDLVVFYDAARAGLAGHEPAAVFVRLTQALTRLLSDRTEDGYVARVDLRLRPDPGATPVALSVPAALSYYETLGQNWERAAFIKARPIAGDLDAGAAFLRELEPFVWRRYFDYAAISDIHAMKRQIHAVRGFAEVVVAGHDVKLGRGGIREIEFFVQTQQLIFGGRLRTMRGQRTLDMLVQLEQGGWITPQARDELTAAYVALRTVEHRLQMIADEQTQRLPAAPEALERFARFCGFGDAADFGAWITAHFRAVELHYARLFEHAPGLDAAAGDLVFTGADDDPATLATLQALGYARPQSVTETVRGWHFGHRAAVRSARAREVLTDLVPALLQSFAKCGDPDGAVAAFDVALARMPAATELFSVLRSSAALRVLFGDLLGAAPRLTAIVTATPHVLDAIIDPRSFGLSLDDEALAAEILALSAITDAEPFLDRCRLLARERQFVIGVQVLSKTIAPRDAGPAFANLAGALVRAALTHVAGAVAREHGIIPEFELAILALGKLGSREMTVASDLDLMIVFRARTDVVSNGRRPLAPAAYAARLTQRLIAALTAPTREGRLYEIDMRLRPWGTQGPLAVSFDAFAAYHALEAETWEKMALCRARPIAGDAAFCRELASSVSNLLAQERSAYSLAADIVAMRANVARTKGDADASDLKTRRGGLLDVEFIAQFLALRDAHADTALTVPGTTAALAASAAAGMLAPDLAAELAEAHGLYCDVLQMQRLTLPVGLPASAASANVRRLVATMSGFPDASALDEALAQTTQRVTQMFSDIVSAPPD